MEVRGWRTGRWMGFSSHLSLLTRPFCCLRSMSSDVKSAVRATTNNPESMLLVGILNSKTWSLTHQVQATPIGQVAKSYSRP